MSTHTKSQAERVIARFGGPAALVRAFKDMGIGRTKASVYRWLKPKDDGGTGGYIPAGAWDDIKKVAHRHGIVLSHKDMAP